MGRVPLSSFFPQISINFSSNFTYFFLILALQVGESPTREGPGYATAREGNFLDKWEVLGTKIWKICVLRAEILAKTRLKIQIFSKNWKWGGTWAAYWWYWWARDRLVWSLHYGVKQRDNSVEDFVHGYSLLFELEAISTTYMCSWISCCSESRCIIYSSSSYHLIVSAIF